MTRKNATVARLALSAVLGALACSAHAAWPEKPIRVIAPFSAGGVSDLAARAAAKALSDGLGQPVVVENRPGAQGLIGAAALKSAPADGYTIALMSSSVVCVNPFLRKDVPFEALRDFTPVGMIGDVPLLMVVNEQLPVATLQDFVAHAKANAGKTSFSSPGAGGSGHLYGALINAEHGLDMTHVPYQGGPPAIQAVVANDVGMTFADLASASPQIAAGRLKPVAIAGQTRWPALPEVPTLRESGMSTALVGWVGLMAPAGTPEPVITRLNQELRRFADSQEARDALLPLGIAARGGSAADMTQAIREGCPPWGDAVRNAGIQPE